jgi:hypothetical protein
MTVWANALRKKYFPNPRPDGFYTGNATPDKTAGLLENYYAWEWSDALFVVLDPFWFTPRAQRDSQTLPIRPITPLPIGKIKWVGRKPSAHLKNDSATAI